MNNPALYDAVIAGVAGSNNSWLQSTNPGDYTIFLNGADALATEIDAAIPSIVGGVTTSQCSLLTNIVGNVFAGRSVIDINSTDYAAIASSIASFFAVMNTALQTSVTAGGSFFQWKGALEDVDLAAAQLLPATDSSHVYSVEFNSGQWEFKEDSGLPPRMVYTGPTRKYHVIVNPHFESLDTDGNAHLPFMNLIQNVTEKHHSHASVIIDIPPIIESTLATATILEVSSGDYITLQYGCDNLSDPSTIQTDFFVTAVAIG
jgi:hypothetical protein